MRSTFIIISLVIPAARRAAKQQLLGRGGREEEGVRSAECGSLWSYPVPSARPWPARQLWVGWRAGQGRAEGTG